MRWRFLVVLLCILFLCTTAISALPSKKSIEKSKKELVLRLKKTKNFSSVWLDSIFTDPRLHFDSTMFQKSTGKHLDYFDKEYGLLSDSSLYYGRAFFERNRSVFDTVYARFNKMGAPELLGLFRVETYFGKKLGRRPVVTALFTLYTIPDRRKFAFRELESFLVICRNNKWDVSKIFSIPGSWAGAFGIPQFMPTSYSVFGEDGNSDGIVDLFNEADAIMSAANYLDEHNFSKSSKIKNIRANQERALRIYVGFNKVRASKRYAKAVFAYADKFREIMKTNPE